MTSVSVSINPDCRSSPVGDEFDELSTLSRRRYGVWQTCQLNAQIFHSRHPGPKMGGG